MPYCGGNPKEDIKEVILTEYTDEEAREHAKAVGVRVRPIIEDEIDATGRFVRQANSLITPFGTKEGDLKAESNRFAIYWSHGCNWSNRPVIARDILGLQDVIGDVVVEETGQSNEFGWGFSDQPDHKDRLTGAYFMSEFYENAQPGFPGRSTTPTFVDIVDKKAVNNDYHRLSNYIEVHFRPFQPVDAPDLYPVKYRKEIDEFNDWLFPHVNNGHYRMAFCTSVEAYDEAYEDFFDSLEKLETRLETNRFIFGDYITDSDIRLYVTLIRWEDWYYRNVGPMKRRIADYKNLWGDVRDLYSIPVFKKYTFLNEGARKDYKSEGGFAPYADRIAPLVDIEKVWATDGERRKLSKTPDEVYLRHPEGETYEEYITDVAATIWNDPDPKARDWKNGVLSVDASINPLKGLL